NSQLVVGGAVQLGGNNGGILCAGPGDINPPCPSIDLSIDDLLKILKLVIVDKDAGQRNPSAAGGNTQLVEIEIAIAGVPSGTVVWQGWMGQRFQTDGDDVLQTGSGDYGVNVPIRVLAAGQDGVVIQQRQGRAAFGFHLGRLEDGPLGRAVEQ